MKYVAGTRSIIVYFCNISHLFPRPHWIVDLPQVHDRLTGNRFALGTVGRPGRVVGRINAPF